MNSFNRPRARSQEFLRTFINDYNQIIRTHTEMMSEYNSNIRNILSIIQRNGEYTSTPTSTPTTTRSSSRSDIATLIYLLSQAGVDDVRAGLSQSQIENATESVLYGVPVITLAPNAADPVSEKKIENVETPHFPDRDLIFDWACHLAYGQVSSFEFENGHAYRLLLEHWNFNVPFIK